MADQLTGRALDEAAAIAMGWTKQVRKWRTPDGAQSMGADFFSTDHDCIPSMFEWLHDNGKTCVIMASYEDHVTCCGTEHIGGNNIHTKGRTLPEALARLVVEVARARGQQ